MPDDLRIGHYGHRCGVCARAEPIGWKRSQGAFVQRLRCKTLRCDVNPGQVCKYFVAKPNVGMSAQQATRLLNESQPKELPETAESFGRREKTTGRGYNPNYWNRSR